MKISNFHGDYTMQKRIILIALAAIIWTQSPIILQAEEVFEIPETTYMDEVVVTATRTENTIKNTSSNIGVVTGSDLEAMDAKTVAEALKKLPGIYYTNASGLEPKISLRGTHIGMSSGALVLLNGIPMNLGKFGYTSFDQIPVENIERVEIVKGPMSSLYGGDAARGVINVITKRPTHTIRASIQAAGGSYNDQRYSALIHGSKDNFDYNLNVKKRKQDGYRDDTAIDNLNFNGEAGYSLSDDTRVSFYLNVTDKERMLAKKLSKAEREEDRRQSTDYSETDNKDIITGFNWDTEGQSADFRTTIYYKNRDKTYENYLRATGRPYQQELDEDIFGLRTIFTWKEPLAGFANKFSIGVDYDNDKTDMQTTKAASTAIGLPYTVPDLKKSGDFKRRETGFFVQDEFFATDNLILTLGVRYDYFKFNNNADYDFTKGGIYDYDTAPSYDKWNPRVALNYRFNDDVSLYTSYSTAYRAPNIYDYYASGSTSATNGYTLTPEKFTEYEAGFRYQFGRWLSSDITVFHITIEDMLDTAYDAGGAYLGKQNIAEATIKGAEIALSGAPCDWFSYRVGYTYTDARYSADILAKPTSSTIVNINGNRLTKVPYNKLNIDLDFRLLKQRGHELLWHLNMLAQDEFAMDKTNTADYAGYTLFNTKLRLVHKSYEVFVAVDNIFGKDYDGYAYRSYGSNYYYPAAGITGSAGLTFKF